MDRRDRRTERSHYRLGWQKAKRRTDTTKTAVKLHVLMWSHASPAVTREQSWKINSEFRCHKDIPPRARSWVCFSGSVTGPLFGASGGVTFAWCFRDPPSPAPASAHEEAIASSRLSLPTGFGRGRCPPVTLMRFCRWAGWLVPVRMDFFVGDMVSVDETTIQFNH